MKKNILTILRNSDKHVSGQEISNMLGVSRTAVWKVITQLRNEGYQVEAISNKGYRITSYPDIITEEELTSILRTKTIGKKIRYYQEVNSTNAEAKRLAEGETGDGLLVISEQQTAGKGRRGRNWLSPKGDGIWMSILLKPNMKPVNASMLTLVTALAVAKTIREDLKMDAYIKWPNDVVVNGKKVCGILTEMSSEIDYIHYVVIGIGINVNIEKFPEELQDTATSLFIEGNKKWNRSKLIASILLEFESLYEQFLKTEDLREFILAYNKVLINNGRMVRILETREETPGKALGINEKGHLLVETQDKVIEVIAGEVSVRGIYGYV